MSIRIVQEQDGKARRQGMAFVRAKLGHSSISKKEVYSTYIQKIIEDD